MNNSTQSAQISTTVQELNEACTIMRDSDLQKEAARLKAVSAAKDLVARLENPAETILQHAFSVCTLDHDLRPSRKAISIWLRHCSAGSGPRMR